MFGLTLGYLSGCNLAPPFVPPVLPAEIQVVVDDPNAFALPAGLAPDLNAPPVADASALAGCWARTFDPQEIDVTPEDTGGVLPDTQRLNARAMDLWHFDAAAQTLQYELYARDEPTGVVLVQVLSGTFELREPGLVAARFDTFAVNDWTTGQMRSEPAPEGPTPESFLHIQVAGDHLFLIGADETGTPDAEEPWAYLHFDCP